MSEQNETSIALLSQKVDLYRNESVDQRAAINSQLTGITQLLEVHVDNISDQLADQKAILADHKGLIAENRAAISEVKIAVSKKSGADAAFAWIGGTTVAVFTGLGAWWGYFHHH
jgi:hypothetical protein